MRCRSVTAILLTGSLLVLGRPGMAGEEADAEGPSTVADTILPRENPSRVRGVSGRGHRRQSGGKVIRVFGRLFGIVALCGATLAVGCGGTGSSVTDCPSYVVTPDAGVTGFSAIGEWRGDAVCAQYCATDFPVCQLASATTVKCQKGCA
jgi:hypothetical protein